jgi:hypothetical protein
MCWVGLSCLALPCPCLLPFLVLAQKVTRRRQSGWNRSIMRALSCLILPCLVSCLLSCLVSSRFVPCLLSLVSRLSSLVISCLVWSCLLFSSLLLSCLVLSCHVLSCMVKKYLRRQRILHLVMITLFARTVSAANLILYTRFRMSCIGHYSNLNTSLALTLTLNLLTHPNPHPNH